MPREEKQIKKIKNGEQSRGVPRRLAARSSYWLQVLYDMTSLHRYPSMQFFTSIVIPCCIEKFLSALQYSKYITFTVRCRSTWDCRVANKFYCDPLSFELLRLGLSLSFDMQLWGMKPTSGSACTDTGRYMGLKTLATTQPIRFCRIN